MPRFEPLSMFPSFKAHDPRDKNKTDVIHVSYMLDRTLGAFAYEGLPDTIPPKVLETYLQVNGFASFAEWGGDLYVYIGGLGGPPDEYYRPTIFTVANPAQSFNANLRIGKDCVIMRNDTLYMGLMPMYKKYAHALTENELSLYISDINSRMTNLISATDDRTIESARKYLTDIESGKLGVIGDSAFLEGLRAQPLAGSSGRSNILDLMEYEQYLRSQWYNEVGLDSNYNMKRERLNTAEVEMNTDSLSPLIDDMLDCRKSALDEVNRIFGTNISVDLAGAWKQNRLEDSMLLGEDGEPEEPGEGGTEDDT